jgi:hypothetical protein
VLYGTNTFRMCDEGGRARVSWIPKAPGQAYIRSVELAVWARRGKDPQSRRTANPSSQSPARLTPETILSTLPHNLPGLRKLYIGFAARAVFERIDRAEVARKRFLEAANDIFAPVDRLALTFFEAELEELEVGVPQSIFHATLRIGMIEGQRFQMPNWTPELDPRGHGAYYSRKRIWRVISEGKGDTAERGYWVSETDSDMPAGWLVSMDDYWR